MATSAGIKIRKKKPRVDHNAFDDLHMGKEPMWDAEVALKFTDEEFDHWMRKSFNFYNYFYNQKDMRKFLLEWVKKNMKLTPAQFEAFSSASPDSLPITVYSLARAHIKAGMPFRARHTEYVTKNVMEIVNSKPIAEKVRIAKAAKAEKDAVAHVPTIQERMAEKTAETIGEMEGIVDEAMHGRPTENIYALLTTRAVPQSQVGKIRDVFQKQINELAASIGSKQEHLKEGYKFLKKDALNTVSAFYVKLMEDLDSYTAVKKATKKARVKKPKSKEKQVAKVKYMKESKELKLISVNPADIIGAQEVWVYHTKYRKLGKYVADSLSLTLGVKGTSITGYDTNLSTAKTLRKPTEQLKELMKAGKVQLRTFLKDIKAVETKLNGRLNAEILILKVG